MTLQLERTLWLNDWERSEMSTNLGRQLKSEPGHVQTCRLRRWTLAFCVTTAYMTTSLASAQIPDTEAARINNAISRITDPQSELSVEKGHSRILTFRTPLLRVSVADPSIAEPVLLGQQEIELIGKSEGSTSVAIWMGDKQAPELLSFVANVLPSKHLQTEREAQIRKLESQISLMFPNSTIRLFPIADKLIVKGQAHDVEEATQIISILRRGQAQSIGNGTNVVTSGQAADVLPDDLLNVAEGMIVINLLRVPGATQVMLKVRIAELKRSAARKMAADFDVKVGDFLFGSSLAGAANAIVSGTFGADSFEVVLEALEQYKVAKILAQPTLVTMSGQTATFISGGEFAVPTVVGISGASAATTDFRGYGTLLNFTPTVLDKDRIRLQVNPQFSTLNQATSVNGIFGVDTRSASTTVELREGQVLAIAGLTQQQQAGDTTRLPGLGNWPAVGTLLSRRNVTSAETELLVVISPEIVQAIDADDAPVLFPGMEVTEPTDTEFYLRNRIEGRPGHHHRSTVWDNYRDELIHPKLYFNSYERSARFFMSGDVGFSK